MSKPIVLTVTRHFDAPPEMVFDAWLNPEAARHFLFATDMGVMERVEIDPRVGGRFLIVERRGDVVAEHFGQYLEIDRPRRLVFTFAAERDAGYTRVQLDFKAENRGTLLTLTHEMDAKWADYETQTRQGWTTILGRSAGALARIVGTVVRRFDMPRSAVWAAWTESERLAQWWGPSGFTAPVCSIDPQPGGTLHIVMQAPDGSRNTMSGIIEEAVPTERLAYAVNLIDASGTLLAKTHTLLTLADVNGATEATVVHSVVPYVEMGPDLLSDMNRAFNESLDRLTG